MRSLSRAGGEDGERKCGPADRVRISVSDGGPGNLGCRARR